MAKTPYTQKEARAGLSQSLRDLDAAPEDGALIRAHCPDAWRTLEEDVDVRERKTHVTLRLDESVAAFYRAMGPGYQARINRVLKTYAQMRIARVAAPEPEPEVPQADSGPSQEERDAEDRKREQAARERVQARWEQLKRMTPEELDAERAKRDRLLAEMEARHRADYQPD